MPLSCAAYKCTSRAKGDKKERFFRFPSAERDRQRREAWISAVRRQSENGKPWKPSAYSRLCGKHFVTGMCVHTLRNKVKKTALVQLLMWPLQAYS
ncbi:hypothetical protein HPB48_008538 [Haemaphysalis longicornis]|uniref:THAP-type domain-containing protein n=1 Tax=Haemaphysalis longicornis TaxID=44386 RepID=A0A9J6GVL1_HAELO|nr:hypothetical protein HPB48_008538 [Haemaphysalis longicornis]